MFGWLFWLWLEQKLSREADFFFVVDAHPQESGHVIELFAHVRVEQSLIAFASTPENEILATKSLCYFDHFFYLSGRVRKAMHVRIRGGAIHVTRIAE